MRVGAKPVLEEVNLSGYAFTDKSHQLLASLPGSAIQGSRRLQTHIWKVEAPCNTVAPMIPSSFQARHPSLAMALTAMAATDEGDITELPTKDRISAELSEFNRSVEPLDEVVDALLASVPDPARELVRISKGAYRHLGVSDDVRAFMGRLWAAGLRAWNSSQRGAFLWLTTEDPHNVFQALDFTAELFTAVDFSADELLPWLKRARDQVGNDFIQRGLWASVQTLCKTSPMQAVRLATAWLNEDPDAQSLSTVAVILGLAREQIASDDPASMPLHDLETRLRASDRPAWRSAYIQSWAQVASRGILTCEKLTELFDEFVTNGGDEQAACSYLLNVIAHRDTVSAADWSWILDKLRRAALVGRPPAAQHWLVLCVLKGLAGAAKSDGSLPIGPWLQLLQSLCPIPSEQQRTWSGVTGALVEATQTAPEVARKMVLTLAAHSGREWLQCDDRSEFRWFLMELAKHNQHDRVATDLCFQAGTFSRRVGLVIFSNSNVQSLQAETVRTATTLQIELLLLEAQRFHFDYAALGRLHAALAARVDELDGELPELLYEEVARQCRNTHTYRTALRAAAPDNDYLWLSRLMQKIESVRRGAHPPRPPCRWTSQVTPAGVGSTPGTWQESPQRASRKARFCWISSARCICTMVERSGGGSFIQMGPSRRPQRFIRRRLKSKCHSWKSRPLRRLRCDAYRPRRESLILSGKQTDPLP